VSRTHHEESATRAVRYHEFGGTEVLRDEEIDRPVPGPGQVLVKVVATSFNPVDEHIRLGILAEAIPTPLPITPGLDVAGIVEELGDGASGLQVGDHVIAMFPLDVHGGAAEYAVLDTDLVTAAPRTIDLADAAALPLTGLAARQAVIELADIKAGQTVLVIGAGGAVGSIVVQLAVAAGATVTAVDAAQHADRLREYGAALVVQQLDLDAGPAAVGGAFDVVVNHVRFADDLAKLTQFVADDGIVVSSAGPVPADEKRSVRTAGVWVGPNAAGLADLVARVNDGSLKLHVADRRPMVELAAVHEEAGSGTLRGKTVIVIG
jgi:NADPH:quinone reductase-like Zn-dependent oxidoreductase